ncbi:EAL domain-containing protein [Asticcacaulis sp. ZE23SCel15]|uniref:bifunctional diguanylate cyclase/phosphodiesterase n=1 Tax=Asticcacaulis sp. ZE23SCel15 TaxID=3059027 RepID=UPI00265E4ADB|nr:EAL domain-containing protein [Asticcacaulis sp. ZE23SCel15]WKL58694.1 EAL domain-containing protein [Asticcacaulis sp. ZE23SCel15]
MFRVISCLTDQHDWVLVALAAIVCLVSSFAAVNLMQRAKATDGASRLKWLLTAGIATGFGIWATHFIAMLAYDPGVATGYDLNLTVLSLVMAIVVTGAGIALAVTADFKGAQAAGGALVGAGIGCMHYMGMTAMQMPGYISWQLDLVLASIVLGMAFGAVALMVAARAKTWKGIVAATGLLVLAIVSHHFTAMGGVVITPDPTRVIGGLMLKPDSMSLAIAVAAMSVLTICLSAAVQGRRMEAAVAASERTFKILVEGVKDYAIYMLDEHGHVNNWNAGAERIKGFKATEIVGRHFSCFYLPEAREAGAPARALQIALETGRYEEEGRRLRKNGEPFWAHVIITPVRDEQNNLMGFAKITRDVTARRADREHLINMSANLDMALSHMSHGLCLFDKNERLVLSNQRFTEIFNLPPEAVFEGARFRHLIEQGLAARDGKVPDDATVREAYSRHKAALYQPGGSTIVAEMSPTCIISMTYRPMPHGGWVATYEDITDRRMDEARIAHMARHDGLTGLPNREHFTDYLDQELDWARRHQSKVAVIAIDLDRFKEINDTRGHAAGDEVLKALSARMQDVLHGDEFVARFGGDEFSAAKRFEDETELMDFISRLNGALSAMIDLDGYELTPEGSLGVAIFPQDAETRDPLMNNADLALYRAKATHGERFCFYEARMDEAARDRRAIAKDLWEAIKNDEFQVYYQIQKSVMTGETTGYEALLRWIHPTRGFVSPVDFIPVAEECGAILDIGEWVLRNACREAASWDTDAKIAVNLSPVQLGNVNLVQVVHEILIETGLSPKRLELEITESTIIGDKVRALHILRQIKALGVTIAIDDFGTGYSSLDTLNSFPFDKIKIDRSFLMEAEQSPQSLAIIKAILALGKSLNVPVLAEGVETETQLSLLRTEGCDEAQGYLLGRPAPMSGEEIRRAKSA